MTPEILYPHQLRAGRALLGWSQRRLAEMSGCSTGTVRHFEKSAQRVSGRLKVRFIAALHAAGVVIVDRTSGHMGGARFAPTVAA